MTDRELLQQALDALEYHQSQTRPIGGTDAAIEALRQRLAQPEPEGWKLVPVDALTRWRDAFSEELSAWDIDPPLHHVKTSYDEIQAVLAAAPQKGTL